MKLFSLFLLILIGFNVYGQSEKRIDSLINEICDVLEKHETSSRYTKDTLESRILFSFMHRIHRDSFDIYLYNIDDKRWKNERYNTIIEKSAFRGTWENLSGKTPQQKDSIINEMCKTFKSSKGMPDSIRLNMLYENHIVPLFSKLEVAEVEKDYLANALDYRFKRNCKEYREFYNSTYIKGWEKPKRITNSELNLKEREELMKRKHFFYIYNKDTTAEISIENGRWLEKYKDDRFAEFKFKWVKDCEFELEFVKSNRFWNKNYSNPGDKYRGIIIDKKENYYDYVLIVIDTDEYIPSKLYF